MPLTYRQKEDFAEKVFRESLENAIEWIKDNLHPNDVFDAGELFKWVSKNAKPDEVFDEDDLAAWAEANGFVREAP